MKLLLVILASIVVSCNGMVYAGDNGESILSTYTAIAVDKFRDIMRKGNATLGIPVMDPFQLKHYPLQLKEDGLVDVKGLISDLKVDGLSDFKVIKADFTIIGVKVSLHLFWDTIKLFTKYSMRGTLASLLSVYGLGDVKSIVSKRSINLPKIVVNEMRQIRKELQIADNYLCAEVQGLDVDVQLSLSVRNEKPYVRSFKSVVKLQKLDLQMTGLFYDEEISKIVSTIVSDMMPQLIEDYQVELTSRLNTFTADFINDFVKDKSLTDLIALLS